MSRSELSFAILVEEMLNNIQEPAYRQLTVELVCIISTILQRNPELTFQNRLDLDQLLADAVQMYNKVCVL